MRAGARAVVASAAVAAIAVLAAWHWTSSKAEREFISRIRQEIGKGAAELDLSSLRPGGWETVCSIHGYDGPTYVKKYGSTYPPAGGAQDGAWGLTFILPDGSYESTAGSRSDGFDFSFGCLERDRPILTRHPRDEKLWVAKGMMVGKPR